jgi:hypothetical protein
MQRQRQTPYSLPPSGRRRSPWDPTPAVESERHETSEPDDDDNEDDDDLVDPLAVHGTVALLHKPRLFAAIKPKHNLFSDAYELGPADRDGDVALVRAESPTVALVTNAASEATTEFIKISIRKDSPELLKRFLYLVNARDREAFAHTNRRNAAILLFSPYAASIHCRTCGFTRRSKKVDGHEYASSFRALGTDRRRSNATSKSKFTETSAQATTWCIQKAAGLRMVVSRRVERATFTFYAEVCAALAGPLGVVGVDLLDALQLTAPGTIDGKFNLILYELEVSQPCHLLCELHTPNDAADAKPGEMVSAGRFAIVSLDDAKPRTQGVDAKFGIEHFNFDLWEFKSKLAVALVAARDAEAEAEDSDRKPPLIRIDDHVSGRPL